MMRLYKDAVSSGKITGFLVLSVYVCVCMCVCGFCAGVYA